MQEAFMSKFSYFYSLMFIWGEISDLGGTSHLNEILFIPGLHEKNVPPEWETFHPWFTWEKCPTWMRDFSSLVYMRKMSHLNEILFIPVSSHASFCIHIILFSLFIFYVNLELLINIYISYIYKMDSSFSRNAGPAKHGFEVRGRRGEGVMSPPSTYGQSAHSLKI